MQTYEYKAIAAPTRARKFKGVKGTAAQFAMVLSELMNEMATDGWEYQRSDNLPVDEKAGLLKGRVETYITMLIFRREKEQESEVSEFIEEDLDQEEPTSALFEPAVSVRPVSSGSPQAPPLKRWPQGFGSVGKMDRLTRKTIPNDETKEPFS